MSNMLEAIGAQGRARELARVIAANDYSAKYGLALTEADAEKLLMLRERELNTNGRVEWDGGVLDRLIVEFADSPFISQSSYADTLEALQTAFYMLKSESMELMDDDELIAAMRQAFDASEGSVDYVEETVAAKRLRPLRMGFSDDELDEDDEEDDEDGDLL